jgi:hypothetical protein
MLLVPPKLTIDVTDEEFNTIYPPWVRELSRKHWTPIAVAKVASQFLVANHDTKVLDIGSGAGKFCLIGAASTKGHFTGVEQRGELVALTRKLASLYHLSQMECIHANITSIDFSPYDAFYFFNSFQENIDIHNKIDNTIPVDLKFYDDYTRYTIEQLSRARVGVRLATYCTPFDVVPRCFELIDSLFAGRLNHWQKTT